MAKKTFKKVEAGDELFYISPTTLTIQGVKVVEVIPLIGKQASRVRVIKNLKYKSAGIEDEHLLSAHEEHGTDIFHKLELPWNDDLAMLVQVPPTVVSTSKTRLEKFMSVK